MRVWLLALAACGAAPTVIANRAPVVEPAAAPHVVTVAAPDYAGCDATGCPMTLVPVSSTPSAGGRRTNGLEHNVAIRHRKLISVGRFGY